MDPSERLAFIRGETRLKAVDLSPEEGLAALLAAIEAVRPMLDHFPMRPLEEIAKEWRGLALVPSSTRAAADTPLVHGVSRDARLLPLHIGTAATKVDHENRHVYRKKFLYMDRKGQIVVWSMEIEYNNVVHGPSSDDATLLSPTSFSDITDNELLRLVSGNSMLLVDGVRALNRAMNQALERRLKIVDDLRGVKQDLDGVYQRIGA